MSRKTQTNVPQPFHDFVNVTHRFTGGVQRLSSIDDSDIGVVTAANQVASLIEGAVEYIAMPSSKNESVSLDEIAEHIAPAVHALGDMVTVFRADAAAGFTSLPDMDDVMIGNNLMGLELGAQYRLLGLMTTVNLQKASPERSELLECLDGIGVPIATVGLQIPVLVKLFIALIVIIIANIFPGFKAIATKILLALAKMDRRGQGGDGGKVGVVAKITCGKPFPVTTTGTGATQLAAVFDALQKAPAKAKSMCPTNCPTATIVSSPVKTVFSGGANGQPFSVDATFMFVCN